jgi:hypothetical protein
MPRTIQTSELKKALKESLAEILVENRVLIRKLLAEVIEDMGLLRAMEEGRKTKLVPREKVMEVLRGKK